MHARVRDLERSAAPPALGGPADLARAAAARRLHSDPAAGLRSGAREAAGDVDGRVLVRIAVAVCDAAVRAQLEREAPERPSHVDVVEDRVAGRLAALERD